MLGKQPPPGIGDPCTAAATLQSLGAPKMGDSEVRADVYTALSRLLMGIGPILSSQPHEVVGLLA